MRTIIKTNKNIMTFNYLYVCVYLAVVMLSSCTCLKKIEKMPPDFDFIAQYGIADENTINTFNNTFTKRINWDKDTTISLHYARMEKEKVYQKIKSYTLEELPIYFVPESNIVISPSPTYYLKFRMNGTFYEVIWETNTFSEERRAKRLRKVFSQIKNYLNKQEIITNLPDDERSVF